MYGYNKSLGVDLILCTFSRVTVVGPLLWSMVCLVTSSWSDNGARCGFYLVECYLSPINK